MPQLPQYVVLRFDPAAGRGTFGQLERFLQENISPYLRIAAVTPLSNDGLQFILEARD